VSAQAKFEEQGKTVIMVSLDGKIAGILAIADKLKATAKDAVAELKKMKLRVVMITGDNARSASVIAGQIGIEDVFSQVLPEEKANEVKKLQEKGSVVAFVGDGINDAPALAQADVGIAIGSGTDVAIETGEIVLMRDDLLDAVAALQLSRKVISRIKQNIFWAFAYNVALVPLAAGALYPFFGITFRPELAGLTMALSSVTVVSLSLWLKRYIPPAKMIIRNGSD
jgi:Cu+-exporting ATPase